MGSLTSPGLLRTLPALCPDDSLKSQVGWRFRCTNPPRLPLGSPVRVQLSSLLSPLSP